MQFAANADATPDVRTATLVSGDLMDALYYESAVRSFTCFLNALAAMGVMSVTLAFAGIYGLVASNVSRTREIGLRMAVGADRARVLRMVLGRSPRRPR